MRSLLFVPGDRPERLIKRPIAAPTRSFSIWRTACRWITSSPRCSRRPTIFRRIIRFRCLCGSIPSTETSHIADVEAILTSPPAGIVLPKAEGARRSSFSIPCSAVRTFQFFNCLGNARSSIRALPAFAGERISCRDNLGRGRFTRSNWRGNIAAQGRQLYCAL